MVTTDASGVKQGRSALLIAMKEKQEISIA
jgi:hypothetical protein